MNHKRHRPKSARAGCLLCKPYKLQRGANGRERQRVSVRRRLLDDPYAWADEVRADPWYPFLTPDEL
jgi:hypothetical protein